MNCLICGDRLEEKLCDFVGVTYKVLNFPAFKCVQCGCQTITGENMPEFVGRLGLTEEDTRVN